MDSNPIAIQIKNLSKRYSKSASADALNDISVDIPLGKIWCLLGPNGSGKTTLLKILAGLVQPNAGEINIMGVDPVMDPIAVKKHTGWMPSDERSGFYGRLTGKQNLRFFGSLHQIQSVEMERRIGNLAFLLDFADDMDEMMLKISSGTRQKIGLARTLLHNPTVLLLDEPLRNLDPHSVLRLRRFLKKIILRETTEEPCYSQHINWKKRGGLLTPLSSLTKGKFYEPSPLVIWTKNL